MVAFSVLIVLSFRRGYTPSFRKGLGVVIYAVSQDFPPLAPTQSHSGKDQGRTKDKPRNTERTPYYQKVLFVKIAFATGLVLGGSSLRIFHPSIQFS